MPKISVIMSVYKEPVEWMKQAIDSILEQTFKDFEFIIVNDNPSREENSHILNKYILKDNRIKLIINDTNIGLTKSLNKAIVEAKGDYIARMDADDISINNRFEIQSDFLDENPDIVVCGSNAETLDENGKIGGKIITYQNDEEIKAMMLFQSPIIHPVAMFRRIIAGNTIRYDEHYTCAQDYALWASLLSFKMANIPQILIQYRLSNNNITTLKRDAQLRYSKEIQNTVFNNLKLQLPSSSNDVLFNLIYKASICSENASAIIQVSKEFITFSESIFSYKIICLIKEHLTECAIRYCVFNKLINNSLSFYVNYCNSIGLPVWRKVALFIKLLLSKYKQ